MGSSRRGEDRNKTPSPANQVKFTSYVSVFWPVPANTDTQFEIFAVAAAGENNVMLKLWNATTCCTV